MNEEDGQIGESQETGGRDERSARHDYMRSFESMRRLTEVPDYTDLLGSVGVGSEPLPRLTEVPDSTHMLGRVWVASEQLRKLMEVPDYTRLLGSVAVPAEQLRKLTEMPDNTHFLGSYGVLFEQLRKLTKLADSTRLLGAAGAMSQQMRSMDVAARSLAEQFVIEVVDAETRAQGWWRGAANQWINEHAWALLWWMISGVVVLMFCMAAATDPALVDAVNRGLGTPLTIIALALAVWSMHKPND